MPHPIKELKQKRKDRGVIGQVKELAGELLQKTALLKQLQEERDILKTQHTILVSICDTLYFLKENRVRELAEKAALTNAQAGQQQRELVLQAAAQRQRINQDMISCVEELLLLQQLAGIEYTGPHFRSADLPQLDLSATAYGTGQHQPISPDEDPCLLMRFISSHPPHAQARHWQLHDVMRHCSMSVPQLAMALAKLDAGLTDAELEAGVPSDDGPCDSNNLSYEADGEDKGSNGTAASAEWVKRAGMGEHPMQTIQRIQIEWLQILGTLMDDCKAVIVMKLSTTNFDTGGVEEAPSKRRHMFVVRNLGLTQRQLQRLVGGYQLFQRLQGQLAEQQRRLQQQGALTAATQASLPAAAAAAAQSTSSGPSAPPAAAAAPMDFSTSTGARLEAEQAAADALNKVLHKQRVLAGLQMFFVIGALSWQQYAKLRVLMSPFTQFAPMLQACILEHAAAVDKQQQQQQQAQAKEKKKPGKKSAGTAESKPGQIDGPDVGR